MTGEGMYTFMNMENKLVVNYRQLISLFTLSALLFTLIVYTWQTSILYVTALLFSMFGMTASIFTIYMKKKQEKKDDE